MTASVSSASSAASFASSGRKRRLPLVKTQLPASVAWLEGLSLDMTAASPASIGAALRPCAAIEYKLHASYEPSAKASTSMSASWTVSRNFEAYVQFQKRLMRTMRKGHACGAECQWLYGVVKNHFPKASLFCTRCPDRVEARRKAMLRVLTTVQTSLLNRGNHRCSVFVNEVSREFADFVLGEAMAAQLSAATPMSSTASERTASLSPHSSPSGSLAFDSDSSDEEEAPSPSSPKQCSFCGCGRDGQALHSHV